MARPNRPARARTAFTLVELVLGMALAVVVLVGLQSAVLIASRTLPSSGSAADSQAVAAAFDRLALDLAGAKSITRSSPSMIELRVPDHDGDASDDTITYRWSGNDADGLERVLNSNKAEVLVTPLSNFAISLETVTVAGGETYVESNETLLSSYTDAGTTSPWSISDNSWMCQELRCSVPSDAVDYRTTRVRLNMGVAGAAAGVTVVSLRLMRNRTPSSASLGRVSINESDLSTAGWRSLSLPSTRYIEPSEPVGLLARCESGSPSASIYHKSGGAPGGLGQLLSTVNRGASWSVNAGSALHYELWGVYRTLEQSPDTTRAVAARVVARTAAGVTEATIALPSRPEVAP